ncbi:MAG: protein kinase, partial [Gammaproteobacteria bacterium]|nr:protein kinase [Gammaproteobacteria bacterium]
AAEKEKYTPQQRQFLRKKLQEYREQQFDRDEYKKIIDAAGSLFDETPGDLFPSSEEKEALINLMEEIKADNKLEIIKDKILLLGFDVSTELLDELWRIIQIAEENPTINFNDPLVKKMLMRLGNPPANILVILSTPADKRTAKQYEQLNEYSRDEENVLRNASIYEEIQKSSLTHEIALEVFCAADSSNEQRKYMAKRIAENIFEYSGEEVIQYLNKLREYELIQSLQRSGPPDGIRPRQYDGVELAIKQARDDIVRKLKEYKNSLFYFNPKRLDISHVTKILKDPSLQREEPVLIDPEYARIFDKILRLIPRDVLDGFRQSTKPFRKYNQYELVRTPNGNVFAIDHAQCLGSGGFGCVFVAYEVNEINGKLGKRVAAKFFNADNSHAQIMSEAKALGKSFDVRGVVSDKVQTCLVMEYVKGKPIAKDSWSDGTFTDPADISTLPLVERFKAIVMLIAEVSTAHQHRNSGNAFLHRDIRLQNVHVDIDNGKVKDVRLLDFGLATFISEFYDPKSVNFDALNSVGALGFIAPEQVKNLKSDMRSLLPTILPLLGVYRLYHSHDIDEHHTVKHYLLSGLLRGMENELPLPLRAALFQFILKMESYDDPNVRPSDDEAFRFFNALYNYCRASDKNAWYEVEYHQELQKNYSEVLPQNSFRWLQQLNEQQNPSPAVREEIQRMTAKVFEQIEAFHKPEISEDEKRILGTYFDHLSTGVISAKIRLLRYFLFDEENENENKLRWEFLVKALSAAQLETESFCAFMCLLNAKRKLVSDIVFKNENNTVLELDKEVLGKFVFLSKTKHYEHDQASWKILADIIVENLDKYSGKDLLIILRKINKFNVENEYNNLRDAVKAKLNDQWGNACAAVIQELKISPTGPSWNRSCVNDLKAAIEGQCFWSRNNHKYLKNAVSESPNQAVDAIVKKLGKVVPAG